MIREATAADLPSLLNLYLFLHEENIPDMTEHLTCVWDQILSDKNHHIIIADVDGCVVSSCVCVIIPNLTRNVRSYAFIENVVTDDAHRKQGFATACLKYARDIARAEDCYKMMLLTGAKDAATKKFYQQAGFNSEDKTAFIQWL